MQLYCSLLAPYTALSWRHFEQVCDAKVMSLTFIHTYSESCRHKWKGY